MTYKEALTEALKVKSSYPRGNSCGCGEGWMEERCIKLEELLNDGGCHCIYDKRTQEENNKIIEEFLKS